MDLEAGKFITFSSGSFRGSVLFVVSLQLFSSVELLDLQSK